MKIGHISFRLAGTDGVSLETAKLVKVLRKMGHTNYYFAGELDAPDASIAPIDGTYYVPLAHFTHPKIVSISNEAFGNDQPCPNLHKKINRIASQLEDELTNFIQIFKIDLITVQNVFSIPMNLALALATYRFIKKTNIPVINHNHDFYWERNKYLKNCVNDLLEEIFPPNLENIQQVVINSQSQRTLLEKGIESTILPNIFDFENDPPGIDEFNSDLRDNLGIRASELFFLQPTRVIPRKGIELSIELVSRLSDLPIKLVITHKAEHDTQDYLNQIQNLAKEKKVDLIYKPEIFEPTRRMLSDNSKIYSLWDAYIHSDFITYPSLYEGFGNALLEMMYFKKPFLINRYQVFKDDIEPKGIKAVKFDGKINDQVADEVRKLIRNPQKIADYVDANTKIGKKYYSFQTAQETLEKILINLST